MWEKWLEGIDLSLPSHPERAEEDRQSLTTRIWERYDSVSPPGPAEQGEVLQCLAETFDSLFPGMRYNPFFARDIWLAMVKAFRMGMAYQSLR